MGCPVHTESRQELSSCGTLDTLQFISTEGQTVVEQWWWRISVHYIRSITCSPLASNIYELYWALVKRSTNAFTAIACIDYQISATHIHNKQFHQWSDTTQLFSGREAIHRWRCCFTRTFFTLLSIVEIINERFSSISLDSSSTFFSDEFHQHSCCIADQTSGKISSECSCNKHRPSAKDRAWRFLFSYVRIRYWKETMRMKEKQERIARRHIESMKDTKVWCMKSPVEWKEQIWRNMFLDRGQHEDWVKLPIVLTVGLSSHERVHLIIEDSASSLFLSWVLISTSKCNRPRFGSRSPSVKCCLAFCVLNQWSVSTRIDGRCMLLLIIRIEQQSNVRCKDLQSDLDDPPSLLGDFLLPSLRSIERRRSLLRLSSNVDERLSNETLSHLFADESFPWNIIWTGANVLDPSTPAFVPPASASDSPLLHNDELYVVDSIQPLTSRRCSTKRKLCRIFFESNSTIDDPQTNVHQSMRRVDSMSSARLIIEKEEILSSLSERGVTGGRSSVLSIDEKKSNLTKLNGLTKLFEHAGCRGQSRHVRILRRPAQPECDDARNSA